MGTAGDIDGVRERPRLPGRSRLDFFPAGHFPVVPGGDLADRLGAAMSWCGTGPGRELVSGVHAYIRSTNTGIDVPVVVATDGHRLLVDGDIEKTTELPDVFRFPAESWAAASKAMATRFTSVEYVHQVHGREDVRDVPPSDRTYLVFSGDDRVVRLRLERPTAALPTWKSLVTPVDGEHDLDVVVDRDQFARVARSASGIGSGSNRNCSIHEGTDGRCIRIRAEGTGGSMEEVVGAEIRSAPEMSVFLNAAYLEEREGSPSAICLEALAAPERRRCPPR